MLLLPFPLNRLGPPLTRRLKRKLKRAPILGQLLCHAWYYLHDPVRRIRRVLDPAQPLSIVQIGSNDGKTLDPLHDLLLANRKWRAILVEPIPSLFARLRANYGVDSRFRFENVAIAQDGEELPFYYISEAAKTQIPDLPFWYDQLGSFREGHIRKHLPENVVPYVQKVAIPTISLNTLLQRNEVTSIDFLHIDAEGYDWIILRQLDLAKYQPAAILFEHVHMDRQSKVQARQFLSAYRIYDLGVDYFCVRRRGKSATLAGVRRIRPAAFHPMANAAPRTDNRTVI